MAKEKRSWRQFQKLNLNSRGISKQARKAEGASTRHAHKFIVQRWANIRDVRRHIIGWMLLVGLLITAVGLQMVWYQKGYRVEAASAGGTYAEGARGPVETLNPLYASSSAERSAASLLFSSLYDYDNRGGIRGDLAQTVTIGDDAKSYTVELKPNVFWHDNTRMTADDIVYTVDLIKDPAARVPIRDSWRDINAEVINESTVRFDLPASIAAFPHALTFPVLPKHILESVEPSHLRESNFSNAPIGSGPFTLRLLQTLDTTSERRVVHMGSFERYFRGAPKLDRFQLHSYSTREAIVQALKTGEVNGAADLSSGDVGSIDKERYEVDNLQSGNGVYAMFNTTSQILRDKTVRSALRLAVDTDKVRSKLVAETEPLDLPFLPRQVRSGDIPSAPSPDVKRAEALLDEAGWKMDGSIRKKDGNPLTVRLVTVKDSDFERVIESLAQQWRSIGVVVDTTVADSSDPTRNVAQNILQPRDYDVLVYELVIGADPDVYVYWHSSQATQSGLNLSNYSNVVADDALASARVRVEPGLRDAKYLSFARQWLDDVPAIGLYESNFVYVHSKRAQTLDHTSALVSPQDRFADIRYWTVETDTVYKTP